LTTKYYNSAVTGKEHTQLLWMSHVKPVGVQLFTEDENADILTLGFHHQGQTGGLHPSQQRWSHTWNRCRRYDSVP